jgi:hypothetical protein
VANSTISIVWLEIGLKYEKKCRCQNSTRQFKQIMWWDRHAIEIQHLLERGLSENSTCKYIYKCSVNTIFWRSKYKTKKSNAFRIRTLNL